MAVLLDSGACVAVAMATAVEASDVAMRYVAEARGVPPPPKIACGYREPETEHVSPINGKDKECMEL